MPIATNKKAYFDYEILERHEAGIELCGHEVKSMRQGHVNLKGSYVSLIGDELFVKGMHITPWKALPNREVIESSRARKIFIPRKKIIYYGSRLKVGGYTLLLLELYFKGSLIKAEIALAKGKKSYQKKQILKEKSMDKQAQMTLKKYTY